MKEKKKVLEFNDDEIRILIRALNNFRNKAISEDIDTFDIDEVFIRITKAVGKKKLLQFDRYGMGVLVNSLDTFRNKDDKEGFDIYDIEELLLKVLNAPEKKGFFHRLKSDKDERK